MTNLHVLVLALLCCHRVLSFYPYLLSYPSSCATKILLLFFLVKLTLEFLPPHIFLHLHNIEPKYWIHFTSFYYLSIQLNSILLPKFCLCSIWIKKQLSRVFHFKNFSPYFKITSLTNSIKFLCHFLKNLFDFLQPRQCHLQVVSYSAST